MKQYPRVLKAIFDRPWALEPATLALMAELMRMRSDGIVLSSEEITTRVEAAQNGDRLGPQASGGVAVIPVYGVISQRVSILSDFSGGTSLDQLRGDLNAALQDPEVNAIILDVDSPGGSVDGLPEMAAELRAARGGTKPIVAVANTLAASAAYWLASQVDELVVTPSGQVGSIGVLAVHEEFSRQNDAQGVTVTLFSSDPRKVEGNEWEPLTEEARATIQSQIDAFYAMFTKDVARGRNVTAGKVAADFGGGRVLLASEALKAGMVDRVDTLDATIRRLSARRGARARQQAVEGAPELVAGASPSIEIDSGTAPALPDIEQLPEPVAAEVWDITPAPAPELEEPATAALADPVVSPTRPPAARSAWAAKLTKETQSNGSEGSQHSALGGRASRLRRGDRRSGRGAR